jgi:dTDP-4-dehydrorhamnose reductase
MPIRIAETGKHGQIARALNEAAALLDVVVIPLGHPELDLEVPETVERL